ncbi:hypothetical protein FZC33_00220 [Labrys sp. KNU-23]|uniref:hypothetical protein n=1 Tax=Labrys sp. KNU-23 TaxID=2789216 RepID=UPI0011EF5448|nr:hypothetical protein [Labrys sp. KNU-23]QEN84754.1 hypothetical protein FZC33_00220 [Labrys sp. KNU-23]
MTGRDVATKRSIVSVAKGRPMNVKVLKDVGRDIPADARLEEVASEQLGMIDNLGRRRVSVLSDDQVSRLHEIIEYARTEATRGGSSEILWGVVNDGEALLAGQPTAIQGSAQEVYDQLMQMFEQNTNRHW